MGWGLCGGWLFYAVAGFLGGVQVGVLSGWRHWRVSVIGPRVTCPWLSRHVLTTGVGVLSPGGCMRLMGRPQVQWWRVIAARLGCRQGSTTSPRRPC